MGDVKGQGINLVVLAVNGNMIIVVCALAPQYISSSYSTVYYVPQVVPVAQVVWVAQVASS